MGTNNCVLIVANTHPKNYWCFVHTVEINEDKEKGEIEQKKRAIDE